MNTVATGPRPGMSGLVSAIVALGTVSLAACLASAATLPNIPTWYAELQKPPLTPPNWVFGPAWSFFYATIALSGWRLLKAPGSSARRTALVAFFLQLALNCLWSWTFFAARDPALGAANIVALVAAIAFTIAAAAKVDRISSGCLLPYLVWVLFATYLNFGVWLLNL